MSQEIELLHKPFREWLNKYGVCHTYHRPDKPTGGTLGDADFILYNSNRCLHLEFKDKLTRVSAVQKKRQAELLRAGCVVHICRTLDAALQLTQEWLGTASAVSTLGDKEKGEKASVGRENGADFGLPLSLWDDARLKPQFPAPVNGEKIATQNIANERLGMWNSQRWLIRVIDGQETMIRIATPSDILRVGVNQQKMDL